MTDYSAATINTGNSLASRLVVAAGAGRLQNIVDNATLTTNGTVTATTDGWTFGSGASVVLPDTQLTQFTVFVWAIADGVSGTLVSRATGGGAYNQNYVLSLISGITPRGQFKEDFTSNYPIINSSSSGTDGTLLTTAFSYDGTNQEIYLNGTSTGTAAAPAPWTNTSAGMVTQIGSSDGTERSATYQGNGIQLVLIFNAALTDAEIASLHANPDQVFNLTSTQTLAPSLFTNSQTFYTPTVTGGAAPTVVAPSLVTNAQTFYAATVAQPGVTAAYVLANTGAVGANPQGFMYDIAGLVSSGDYMTYTTVSGPTPGGGTLVEYVDGRFEYTGGAPAVWVVQVKINGSNYFETTTVYLYDQLFTLLPSLFTNSQTFYTPTVTRGVGTQTLAPSLVTNNQTFFGPSIVLGAANVSPSLFTNFQVFYRPTLTGGIPGPVVGSDHGGKSARSCMRPAMYPAMNKG